MLAVDDPLVPPPPPLVCGSIFQLPFLAPEAAVQSWARELQVIICKDQGGVCACVRVCHENKSVSIIVFIWQWNQWIIIQCDQSHYSNTAVLSTYSRIRIQHRITVVRCMMYGWLWSSNPQIHRSIAHMGLALPSVMWVQLYTVATYWSIHTCNVNR